MLAIRLCFILTGLLSVTSLTGQLSYGFRAGLSFSKLNGDLEQDASGTEVEKYGLSSGFHIGFSLNYAVTDLFGFRGEAIFTQRGFEYEYDGGSYYFLARRTADERVIFGNRVEDYSISMSTIEIPILAYYKIGPVELIGGLTSALILSSNGGGSLNFDGMAPSGNAIDPFEVNLQYNYNKDNAAEAGETNMIVKIDNINFQTPETTYAYYDFDSKDGNKYKTFDLGITGGLNFYFNEGLYIGGRVTYGLSDADDNQYDISLNQLQPDMSYVYRSDKNHHLTINASLGFLF